MLLEKNTFWLNDTNYFCCRSKMFFKEKWSFLLMEKNKNFTWSIIIIFEKLWLIDDNYFCRPQRFFFFFAVGEKQKICLNDNWKETCFSLMLSVLNPGSGVMQLLFSTKTKTIFKNSASKKYYFVELHSKQWSSETNSFSQVTNIPFWCLTSFLT